MGHIYLSHSHPIAIYACPIPWDSHGQAWALAPAVHADATLVIGTGTQSLPRKLAERISRLVLLSVNKNRYSFVF